MNTGRSKGKNYRGPLLVTKAVVEEGVATCGYISAHSEHAKHALLGGLGAFPPGKF